MTPELVISILSLSISLFLGIVNGIPTLKRIKAQNANDWTTAFDKVASRLNMTQDELIESFAEVAKLKRENIEKEAIIEEQREMIKGQYEQIEFLNTRVRDLIALLKKWIFEAETQGYKFSEFDKNLLDTGPLNKK